MKTFKNISFNFLIAIFVSLSLLSCKKEPEIVSGCTDSTGDNYNPSATEDNESCTFQKRFLGEYTGTFNCQGSFAGVFSMADMSITELVSKTEVNIIIQSTIGPLPLKGTLTRNEITVDSKLENLPITIGDIIPGGGTGTVLADGEVKTILTISADNKMLTGDLNLKLVNKEPLNIPGFPLPFPAGSFMLTDVCGFIGIKK